jgi:hypothetical protein
MIHYEFFYISKLKKIQHQFKFLLQGMRYETFFTFVPNHFIVDLPNKLNTMVLATHQTLYMLNLKYATIMKYDMNKLLIVGFIRLI